VVPPHAALAALLTAGLWPVRGLRWIAVALNVLMLVSIPIDGGHYFVDVLAGLGVAGISLVSARLVVERFAWSLRLTPAFATSGSVSSEPA